MKIDNLIVLSKETNNRKLVWEFFTYKKIVEGKDWTSFFAQAHIDPMVSEYQIETNWQKMLGNLIHDFDVCREIFTRCNWWNQDWFLDVKEMVYEEV